MGFIILQQQMYNRSAKWIVNAANTIRLIMHYYNVHICTPKAFDEALVRLMQNKVIWIMTLSPYPSVLDF